MVSRYKSREGVEAEIGKRLYANIELLNIDSGSRAAALASGRADTVFWMHYVNGPDTQPDIPESISLEVIKSGKGYTSAFLAFYQQEVMC